MLLSATEKSSRGKPGKQEDNVKTDAAVATRFREEEGASQAKERTRWMPGRMRPMKDAETGETFKGSCIRAMSLENPNGATRPE